MRMLADQRIKASTIVGSATVNTNGGASWPRVRVKGHYGTLTELTNEVRPDVVHITTPPASHFDNSQAMLEHGCHVYVEKNHHSI